MPTLITFAAIALSFLICFFVLPFWIRRAEYFKFTAKDVHKHNKKVAELGGLVTVFSAIIGVLLYIASHTFYYSGTPTSTYLFPAITSLFIAMTIGLVDDLLGWKVGLRQYQKLLVSFLIPLPLMVVNAGVRVMDLPLGVVDVGVLYPLLVIPVGMVGASNAFNMLAGFNGLEAGLGIIQIATLGFIAFREGSSAAAVLAASLVMALLAFFYYNRYPARVFGGDTLTYPVGTSLAIIAILGNVEKYALILFLPYGIEFLLKARGKFQKESFGKLVDDCLVNRYDRWYGLEHVAISVLNRYAKATEPRIVSMLWGMECVLAVVAIAVYL